MWTEQSGKVNKQGSGSDAICEREGRCRPRVIYPKDRDEREDSEGIGPRRGATTHDDCSIAFPQIVVNFSDQLTQFNACVS